MEDYFKAEDDISSDKNYRKVKPVSKNRYSIENDEIIHKIDQIDNRFLLQKFNLSDLNHAVSMVKNEKLKAYVDLSYSFIFSCLMRFNPKDRMFQDTITDLLSLLDGDDVSKEDSLSVLNFVTVKGNYLSSNHLLSFCVFLTYHKQKLCDETIVMLYGYFVNTCDMTDFSNLCYVLSWYFEEKSVINEKIDMDFLLSKCLDCASEMNECDLECVLDLFMVIVQRDNIEIIPILKKVLNIFSQHENDLMSSMKFKILSVINNIIASHGYSSIECCMDEVITYFDFVIDQCAEDEFEILCPLILELYFLDEELYKKQAYDLLDKVNDLHCDLNDYDNISSYIKYFDDGD